MSDRKKGSKSPTVETVLKRVSISDPVGSMWTPKKSPPERSALVASGGSFKGVKKEK